MNTSTLVRRFVRLAVPAAVLAAGLAFSAGTANAAGNWQYSDYSGNCYHTAILDSDLNGYANQVVLDTNGDCYWDSNFFDTNGYDALLETVTYDSNADGVPEVWFNDTDQLVGFDAGYADPEQDGVWAGPYNLTSPGASALVLGAGVIGGGDVYGGITVLGPNGQPLTDAERSALYPGYATIGGGTYASTGNLQVDILMAQANNALIETILAPPCNNSYNGCA